MNPTMQFHLEQMNVSLRRIADALENIEARQALAAAREQLQRTLQQTRSELTHPQPEVVSSSAVSCDHQFGERCRNCPAQTAAQLPPPDSMTPSCRWCDGPNLRANDFER